MRARRSLVTLVVVVGVAAFGSACSSTTAERSSLEDGHWTLLTAQVIDNEVHVCLDRRVRYKDNPLLCVFRKAPHNPAVEGKTALKLLRDLPEPERAGRFFRGEFKAVLAHGKWDLEGYRKLRTYNGKTLVLKSQRPEREGAEQASAADGPSPWRLPAGVVPLRGSGVGGFVDWLSGSGVGGVNPSAKDTPAEGEAHESEAGDSAGHDSESGESQGHGAEPHGSDPEGSVGDKVSADTSHDTAVKGESQVASESGSGHESGAGAESGATADPSQTTTSLLNDGLFHAGL